MTTTHGCPSCKCAPALSDEEIEAFSEAELKGEEEGHVHCPDCGCDPKDHRQHADGCRRIGQDVEIQCGPPWNPFPGEGT